MRKSVISWLILGIVWQLLAWSINKPILVPYPKDVILVMSQQIASSQFWLTLGHTFFRVLIAFTLSLIISFLLVFLLRRKGLIAEVIHQILTFIRIVPTAAIILMALVWLSSSQAIILITLLVMIPLMTDMLKTQFEVIESNYSDPLKLFGSTTLENILKVLIPLSLSSFLSLCKSAFLLGLKVTVSSEVLVSIQQGLGRELQYARFDLDMNRLFAITLWIVIASILVSKGFDVLIDKTRH